MPNASWPSVPTAVMYDSAHNMLSWGFGCKLTDPSDYVWANLDFAPILDPDGPDGGCDIEHREFAQTSLTHFLREVYRHLRSTVEAEGSWDWDSAAVDFIFAKPRGDISWMVQAIKDAGFGRGSRSHRIIMKSL